MIRKSSLAPLALALFALSACGSQGGGSTGGSAAAPVQGKAAPAGTTWSQTIVATPEGGFRMGNPDAPIKLIEYGSYTCPHCRDFTESAHAGLEHDYVNTGKVSFEYRNFVRDPLDIAVSLLARCSGPEPFFPLTLQFFENQQAMIEKLQSYGDSAYQAAVTAPPNQRFVKLAELGGLIDFAKQRGIPEDKARQCLSNAREADALATGVDRAVQQFQINGTPTIIMNGSKLENVATWPTLLERLKDAGA